MPPRAASCSNAPLPHRKTHTGDKQVKAASKRFDGSIDWPVVSI